MQSDQGRTPNGSGTPKPVLMMQTAAFSDSRFMFILFTLTLFILPLLKLPILNILIIIKLFVGIFLLSR